MKKLFPIIALIALIAGAYFVREAVQARRFNGPAAPDAVTVDEIKEVTELPSELNIELPFYTQAPYGNWDYPWQEACEEASILLVANLYKDMNLDLENYNNALLTLVDWEMETFGAYEHTTVEQTIQMLEENFGLEGVAHENPTFEDMQEILAKGHLIVAPFAGKELNNPNFRNGGPIYHMLVIKGYDAEKHQVVTHDVGTRNGEDYVYSWSTIQNALHDWHDDDILLGTKQFIEVLP